MSDDLIARLEAAHEAATPGPWEWSHDTGHRYMHMRAKAGLTGAMGNARLFLGCFSDDSLDSADAELFVLTRNALPQIIEALEAGQALDAAWSDAIDAMDDDNIIPTELWADWMAAHRAFRVALRAASEPAS